MAYRVLGIGAIVVCLISISAVILAVALKGGITTNGPSIASLVAFLGLLTTSLVTVLSVTNVQAKLNGHIAKHELAVKAAQSAATASSDVGEQLTSARAILDKIHYDTNSRFAETRAEVVNLKEQVVDLKAELQQLLAGMAKPGEPPT